MSANTAATRVVSDTKIPATVPRTLFTSEDWRYDNIKTVRNTSSVTMTNIKTGAVTQMSVESENGPDYRASMRFEQAVPQKFADILRLWMDGVCKMHDDIRVPAPAPLPAFPHPVALSVSMDIHSDPTARHFRAQGRVRLGESLEAEVAIGALNGSIEVTARGKNMPLFLIGGQDQSLRKVEMVNIHRDGRDGAIEAIVTTVDHTGQFHSEGISLPNFGASGEVDIPLIFPGGTLTSPAGADGNRELNAFGRYLTYQMEVAVLTGIGAILLSVNGKYKCLRSTLNLLGASLFCVLGILATGPTPGIIGAIALCFGSKVLAALDLILNHLGVES